MFMQHKQHTITKSGLRFPFAKPMDCVAAVPTRNENTLRKPRVFPTDLAGPDACLGPSTVLPEPVCDLPDDDWDAWLAGANVCPGWRPKA